MSLTKNSSNAELTAGLPNVADGQTRIFAKEVSSNPKYTTIFLCQSVDGGNADAAQKLFLGWSNRMVRAIHNATTEIAATFKVGAVVPLDIKIVESTTPAYDGQKAKINPSTSEVITFNGLPVYEHGTLVAKGQGSVTKLAREAAVVADPASLIGA